MQLAAHVACTRAGRERASPARAPGPGVGARVKVRCIAVGKVRDRALAEVIAGFETRAARYWPLEVVEVREEHVRDAAVVKQREGARLLEKAAGSFIVACDERGDALTSEQFAAWLQGLREAGRDVAFLIGGAFGLDAAVGEAATRRLTLAPFTLPHDMARLVLAEQLYRAGTIVRREPYHKA